MYFYWTTRVYSIWSLPKTFPNLVSCSLLFLFSLIQPHWFPCYFSRREHIRHHPASGPLHSLCSLLENFPSSYLNDLFLDHFWPLFKLHLFNEPYLNHLTENWIPHPPPLLYLPSPFPNLFFYVVFVTILYVFLYLLILLSNFQLKPNVLMTLIKFIDPILLKSYPSLYI